MGKRTDTKIFKTLRIHYEKDMQDSSDLMTSLTISSKEELEKLLKILERFKSVTSAVEIISNLIKEAVVSQKNPVKMVKSQGKRALGRWAEARISDQVVKMLFKELIEAYRSSHSVGE